MPWAILVIAHPMYPLTASIQAQERNQTDKAHLHNNTEKIDDPYQI